MTLHGRIRVPYSGRTRQIFMDEAHKSISSIHPGVTKMYNDLRHNYWLSCMKKDIVWFLEQFLTYRKVKVKHQCPHDKL